MIANPARRGARRGPLQRRRWRSSSSRSMTRGCATAARSTWSTMTGARAAVHFGFNAWGEKFPPWDRDAAVGRLIAEQLGDRVVEGGMVLEGGSIRTDGTGTLLTTEQCLLTPTATRRSTREEIEAGAATQLGVETVRVAGEGLVEDRDTDGHVDLIAAFIRAGRGAAADRAPTDNPNFDPLRRKTSRVLVSSGVQVTEMPYLPYATVAGREGRRQLPELLHLQRRGDRAGGRRRDRRGGAPDHRRGLSRPRGRAGAGLVLAYGGGGPHCITQQVPLARWHRADARADHGVPAAALAGAHPPARARAAAPRPRPGALARRPGRARGGPAPPASAWPPRRGRRSCASRS